MAGLTWIKLNLDMFDNKKIKQIRKMPGGNDMVLFWVMLLTLAGKSNSQGYILFTENIAYTPEMLANECDMELNTVKMALELFSRFNMITIQEETILITGWSEHQNAEELEKIKEREQARLRKRNQREREKQMLTPAKDEICSHENKSCDNERDVTRDIRDNERDLSYIEREKREIESKNKEREKEDVSLNDKAIEICRYYDTATFGKKSITPQLQTIKELVNLYPMDWIQEAIDMAIGRNRNGVDYIWGILRNWAAEGHEKVIKSEIKGQPNEQKVAGWNHFKKFS